jgi:hypothetical protein
MQRVKDALLFSGWNALAILFDSNLDVLTFLGNVDRNSSAAFRSFRNSMACIV